MVNLSVIVPVYNAEKTLRRCVDSILASDEYRAGSAEIVLINDGSSDGSADICSQYAHGQDRILTITTDNAGVSAARNRGLTVASGTFVAFVDSDDYVGADYHATALTPLTSGDAMDLVVAGFTKVTSDGAHEAIAPTPEVIDKTNMPSRIVDLANSGLLNSVCNKVYRLSVIDKHDIEFETGRKSAEDLFFNLDYARVARATALVETTGLYYVANQSSSTHSLARKHDQLHDLDTSMAYRSNIQRRFSALGIPASDIDAYFRSKDHVWFHIMVRNVQNPGTPYSVREQIQQVRRIMDFAPARKNILGSKDGSRLAKMNRILYRANSAHLAWLVRRLI